MASSSTTKINISSMQVLKTLKLLMTKDYSMVELIKDLNKNEKKPVFNNSVVSKYISTCRYCGIEIPKIHNKYYVSKIPFGLDLSKEDIEMFEVLQNIALEKLGKKSINVLNRFLEKVERFSNKRISRVEGEPLETIQETFDMAINDERRVQLFYKDKTILECIPLGLFENKGKLYFHVVVKEKDKDKEKLISIGRIVGVKVLSSRFRRNQEEIIVIYKLKGDLAKRYTVKENEQVLGTTKTELIISNKGENIEILLSRLMRYDSDCEITNPSYVREEMKQRIASTLSNYGE